MSDPADISDDESDPADISDDESADFDNLLFSEVEEEEEEEEEPVRRAGSRLVRGFIDKEAAVASPGSASGRKTKAADTRMAREAKNSGIIQRRRRGATTGLVCRTKVSQTLEWRETRQGDYITLEWRGFTKISWCRNSASSASTYSKRSPAPSSKRPGIGETRKALAILSHMTGSSEARSVKFPPEESCRRRGCATQPPHHQGDETTRGCSHHQKALRP